jgi:hypothetical protein
MNCPEYIELEPNEQSLMIGQIVHALQTDTNIFKSCQDLIALAYRKGVYDNVKIGHEQISKVDGDEHE